MDSKSIRKEFLNFFKEKGHQIVPSAPMVVKNDPTLMFTNAGMNQFKDFFLGHKTVEVSKVTDTQKCLRVSGKHNDLEEVGMDTYHHTMFEMLGNWSFGDYFKKEAIEWAWELLTVVYKLPKDRLYASVFEGDKSDGLEMDHDAFGLWKDIIGEDRIIYGSKKDNFWEMGDTGPCGPCSELHIDLRTEEECAAVDGKSLVNEDHPQVVEIWNLVFMQYNRLASGELENLPSQHVDTGMGFERLCMAVQGEKSNYDTDVFKPLIEAMAKKAKLTYGDDEKKDIAIRVISDHIRAISFAIADGQLPSNNGAGYVIRRILRRAVRYGYTFLGFREAFMYELLPILADQFDGVFPELVSQKDFVAKVVKEEELSFLRTLETGLKRLEVITDDLKKSEEKIISGKQAFELYDTFGFPLDLTSLIARENGLSLDEEGFTAEMKQQKDRSKADAVKEMGDWIMVKDGDVEFIGYDHLEGDATIVKYRTIVEKKKERYQLVLNQTPFYAESGGQVGDTGHLEANGTKISVLDTKKENDLIVHFVDKLPSDLKATFKAVVNANKRSLTTNNHSATHLLHAALRQVLGTHVEQRGSLVNEKALRFDFSHFSKLTEEEIAEVERIVNVKIRENIQLDEKRNVPIEEAKEMGAMALFGEKYGDNVRVITFDKEYSVELCGGIHVPATCHIGLMKITSESSIAAGVRRIEAITSQNAQDYFNKQETEYNEIKALLKDPKDAKVAIVNLIDERNALLKAMESVNAERAQMVKKDLLNKVQLSGNINTVIEKVSLPNADALKTIAFELKNQVQDLFMVLAGDIDGKPQIAVVVSDNLVKEKELHAGNIVRELAKEIKGGGGGQPFYATAGGKDISGLDKVIEKAKQIVSSI
jgi:alanyl-tRNA synthetase